MAGKKSDSEWESEWKGQIAAAEQALAEKTAELEAMKTEAQHNTTARVKELEDWLAFLQKEMHRLRINLQEGSLQRDFSDYYVKTRTLLGDRGQQIDAGVRG